MTLEWFSVCLYINYPEFLIVHRVLTENDFCFHYRCHSSPKPDSSSYEERKISKEFEDLTLDELEVIATLGMGGFGRVELVITGFTLMPFFRG